MKIQFWGAAGTVTGSQHVIESNGKRLLLDCGLFQGRRKEARERNESFPVPAADAFAVILSHAHIDHSGNLPGLVKQGFEGAIHATPATVELCGAMLRDSAYLQEKDAAFVNKRQLRRKMIKPEEGVELVQPLYSMEDAERTLPMFRPVGLRRPTNLVDGLAYEFHEAGHILGSTSLLLHEKSNGKVTRLGFSGDLGRPGLPIIRDPEPLPPVDYLILESTYGGRLHKAGETVEDKLANVVSRTAARGGKIVVPAFAVGRTQQLVLLLHRLTNAGRIPTIPVFVDSPLAVNVTDVFRRHVECFDDETRAHLLNDEDPFGFRRLRYVRDVAESKALNDYRGPVIIISASGMCEGGRILHHLRNNMGDPRNTVLITGFQAAGTLGRKLVDRMPEPPVFGEPVRLRAEVVTLNELSGHADQHEILTWLKPLAGQLKAVFLVHGEPLQSQALARAIEELHGLRVVTPVRGDVYSLD